MFSKLVSLFPILAMALLSACAANSPPEGQAGAVQVATADVSTAPAASAVFQSESDYVLGQGDEISILVFDEPDLSLDAQVGASGFINYSYLGNVQVANKTPLQLENHIAELLKNGYLVNPSVNVSVKKFRPFYIGGEVRSPGSYQYQPGLTLERAIAMAGGLTERASVRKMFLVEAGSASAQRKVTMGEPVNPGDTITIQEGFF